MKTFTVISEEEYASKMKTEVEPFLEKIRISESFNSFDGKKIHYEAYVNKEAKAGVVISHGFCETAEKFRELSYYFFNAGFSVFALDHRCHGLSYRIKAAEGAVKVNSFDDYAKDMNLFLKKVVKPQMNQKPIYAYSHSLGSTVMILYMLQNENLFSKVVLSSPMICGNMGMPVGAAKVMASVICALGGKELSVPGKCKFDENQVFESSDAVSKARFEYYLQKRIDNKLYRTNGPSFGWVKQSLKAKDFILKDENCKKISVPVLMFKPSEDKQVLESFQDEFAKKLSNVEVVYVPNSKHEIFSSKSEALEQYMTKIIEFFG